MKVLLFGATGMVGQGVLRACLAAADVQAVTTVGRTALAQAHPKLQQVGHADLTDLGPIADQLRGFDACFFCLGVSAAGLSEAEYRHLTHDLPMAVAQRLSRLNTGMTFVYVSGAGTDSSEQGRSLWARVKGQTENDLRKLPFAQVCLFRPGIIQPLDGIQSKTRSYRLFYAFTRPLLSIARTMFPKHILTTRSMGLAMLNSVRHQRSGIFEPPDIARLAAASPTRQGGAPKAIPSALPQRNKP